MAGWDNVQLAALVPERVPDVQTKSGAHLLELTAFGIRPRLQICCYKSINNLNTTPGRENLTQEHSTEQNFLLPHEN